MTKRLGAELPAADVLDFGTSHVVHHCNYLAQPKTVEFLRRTLELP